jgi:hypothetical protein
MNEAADLARVANARFSRARISTSEPILMELASYRFWCTRQSGRGPSGPTRRHEAGVSMGKSRIKKQLLEGIVLAYQGATGETRGTERLSARTFSPLEGQKGMKDLGVAW